MSISYTLLFHAAFATNKTPTEVDKFQTQNVAQNEMFKTSRPI